MVHKQKQIDRLLKEDRKIFKQFDKELKEQEKMNVAFIGSLPKTTGDAVAEFGREAKEGIVPEIIPPEKIKQYEKDLRKYER